MSATHAALFVSGSNSGQGTPLAHVDAAPLRGGTSPWTIGAFFLTPGDGTLTSHLEPILAKWGATSPTKEFILCTTNADTKFHIYVGDGAGGFAEMASNAALAAGTLYFVVARYDGAAIHLFVDAVEQGTGSAATANPGGSAPLMVGGDSSGSGFTTSGKIGMAFKYPSALSGTLITWLFNGGFFRSTAEILAHAGLGSPDLLLGFDNSGNLGLNSLGVTYDPANDFTNAYATGPTQTAGPGSGQATTATVAGPTSLAVGVTSGNYTITLPTAAMGAIDFTPAASGFSATPTPSTVTIANGATTATFVLNPSSAGSGSVTATSPGVTVTGQSGVTSSSSGMAAGTLAAGTLTATTAAASIATSTGTSPFANQLQVSPRGANTWTSNGSPVAGAAATLTATGLTPATQYDLRVIVTDAALRTATSNTVAVTTPATPATTYTLTGPAAGTVNLASTNFTVQPDGVFSGTITIALSGGGLSTTVVKTFAASAAGQDFTITPTATGTVTLAPTNSGSLSDPASLPYASNPASVTTTSWQTGVFDTFEPGLVGGTTPGFGYKVGLNGGSFGSLVTSGISEDSPGSYSAQVAVGAGNVPRVRWFDGSGGDVTDLNPVTLPGSGGGGGLGNFPVPAPANWLNRAAVADDLKLDGTMRAPSSGGVVRLDAADRIANGATGTVAVNQYLQVMGGAGLGGPLVPIATVSGSSGARNGAVAAGWPDPGLDATSQYIWTGVPTTVDLAQPVPIRDQRGVTDPNIGDALAVIHALGMGHEAKDPNARTLTLKAANQATLMVFDLDNAANPNVRTPRSS